MYTSACVSCEHPFHGIVAGLRVQELVADGVSLHGKPSSPWHGTSYNGKRTCWIREKTFFLKRDESLRDCASLRYVGKDGLVVSRWLNIKTVGKGAQMPMGETKPSANKSHRHTSSMPTARWGRPSATTSHLQIFTYVEGRRQQTKGCRQRPEHGDGRQTTSSVCRRP
jgi:hypothetical protein